MPTNKLYDVSNRSWVKILPDPDGDDRSRSVPRRSPTEK